MKFRLLYEGPIAPWKKGNLDTIHDIRMKIYPQMKALWDFPPISTENKAKWLRYQPPVDDGDHSIFERRGTETFAPLISGRVNLQCELDITFLRQQAPGQLIGDGGDIDNRVKTLLDALSVPTPAQASHFTGPGTEPIFCLLQDDLLVTRINVETDRLLRPASERDLVAIIQVTLRASKVTWGTIGFL